MPATIKLKNGSGVPLAGDLVQGEPALDLTNKRLYTENAAGAVIEIGTNPSSITTTTVTASGNVTGANLAIANWNAAYNDKINSAAFNTGDGVLTLSQQDGGTVTVDLDGRYSTTDTTYSSGTNITVTGGVINLNASITGLTEVATTNVSIGSWDIQLDGADLRFIYNGTDVLRLTTTGQIIALNDVTAYGAP